MDFNFNNIANTEFFIQKSGNVYQITMDTSVKTLLKSMINTTKTEIGTPAKQYDPSEKYNSSDKLTSPLTGDYCQKIRNLFNLGNVNTNNSQIQNSLDKIAYYYCRLTDNNGQKLLAIKRATYFKALTANHNPLIGWANDKLTQYSGSVFKLDSAFDMLVYNNVVYINKYLVFEGMCELSTVVKSQSSNNMTIIEQQSPLILFSKEAKDYIQSHISAARLIASIKASGKMNHLDITNVEVACKEQGITISNKNGKISLDKQNTMDFLKLIDRRLYSIDLTGSPEKYEAKSREER